MLDKRSILFKLLLSSLSSQTNSFERVSHSLQYRGITHFHAYSFSSRRNLAVVHNSPLLGGLLLNDSRSFDCPVFQELKTLTAL